jgi:hypothetical protein
MSASKVKSFMFSPLIVNIFLKKPKAPTFVRAFLLIENLTSPPQTAHPPHYLLSHFLAVRRHQGRAHRHSLQHLA